MNLPKVKMLQVSKCLIGLAVMMLQSCDVADNRRDMLCGNWESVEGKPDVLIYKEGEAYKVTVFRRSGLRRKLKPETYLLQEEKGIISPFPKRIYQKFVSIKAIGKH